MISFILTFLWEVVVVLVSPSPYIKETNAENGSWTEPLHKGGYTANLQAQSLKPELPPNILSAPGIQSRDISWVLALHWG